MSEEKLKNFGELLKETLGGRSGGEEVAPIEEASTQMSDEDRSAIFAKLAKAAPATPKADVPRETTVNEDTSNATFGELLEKATQTRMEIENEDNKADEEIREAVVENSRVDLVDDMLKRFMR